MVERLANIPTLMGWKDGQGDIRRLQAIMSRVGTRLHWIGGAVMTWSQLITALVFAPTPPASNTHLRIKVISSCNDR